MQQTSNINKRNVKSDSTVGQAEANLFSDILECLISIACIPVHEEVFLVFPLKMKSTRQKILVFFLFHGFLTLQLKKD